MQKIYLINVIDKMYSKISKNTYLCKFFHRVLLLLYERGFTKCHNFAYNL